MHVVIFRARIRHLDDEYVSVAARMRELAMTEFGCLEFQALAEGHDEVALSWWPDEESIRAWRACPEHVEAQRKGRERWYESWSIEVTQVSRRYEGRAEMHSRVVDLDAHTRSAPAPRAGPQAGGSVLSVDLAFRSCDDIGVCALRDVGTGIEVTRFRLSDHGLHGAPTSGALAKAIAALAGDVGARLVLIDGPQAWKDPDNGIEHSRLCERVLATPGKTGTPGVTKPANYAPFIGFSIDFFDELSSLGWPRLASEAALRSTDRFAVESFPTSAWRGLGLRPLPGKAKTPAASIGAKLGELRALCSLECADDLTHDELQAVVAGLAGIAAEGHATFGCALAGTAPFELDGTWREGFILNPLKS